MARIRAIAIVSTLVITAVVLIAVTLKRDSQHGTTQVQSCPNDSVKVSLTLPNADAVAVNVYNATKTPGLATQVAENFTYRGVKVEKTGNSKKIYKDDVAVISYGPKTIAAAHVLQGYFLGDAEPAFEITNETEVVDIFIGGKFQQLATLTEFNQWIGANGRPSPPPGTCEPR